MNDTIRLSILATLAGVAMFMSLKVAEKKAELDELLQTERRLKMQLETMTQTIQWQDAVIVEQQRWLEKTNHPELSYIGE